METGTEKKKGGILMRDRLIELIKQGEKKFADKYEGKEMSHIYEIYDFLADCLLENGVIVPPCKVGDKLYYIVEGYVLTRIVELIKIYDYGIQLITTVGSVYEYDGTRWYNITSNKTAYFSEDEALQALKGGGE